MYLFSVVVCNLNADLTKSTSGYWYIVWVFKPQYKGRDLYARPTILAKARAPAQGSHAI